MAWRLLADALLLVHLAFIVFVLLGGLLVRRRRSLAWLHLPAAFWGAWVEFSGTICPLTPWEQAARLRAGEAGWQGDFLEHYLLRLIYPDGLTQTVMWVLGFAVLAINALVYAPIVRDLACGRRRSRS
jgi:hypothetical protein